MLWSRDEYLSHMTFRGSSREMFTELFGPLVGLDEEWRRQGATEDEISLRAFGWDGVKYSHVPARFGAVSGITPHVLEETADHIIAVDEKGGTTKLCKGKSTIALPMSFPVKTPEDWERIKPWYTFSEDRIDYDKLQQLKKQQQEGVMVIGSMPGGFDELRELLGEENLCYSYYDEPEMIEDMLATFSDTANRIYERISDYVTVDYLHVHEDMAGKSGPLVGGSIIRQFISPYYHSVWDNLHSAGAQIFSQDSDGNMTAVVEDFIQAGINCMYPCEPMAGMDVVQLRKKYGNRVAFKGGIDKFCLRGIKEDIREELEYKLSGALHGGGMIYAIDHRIPNGVPIENYRYYVKLGRELLGHEYPAPSDHIRMAF